MRKPANDNGSHPAIGFPGHATRRPKVFGGQIEWGTWMALVPMHGGAAAAEHERQMRLEEEELTPYSVDDLAQDWEFKILRSATGAFRSAKRLREVLEDEARAGWVLVEKFDNSRVRLKRPAKARDRDGNLNFDPYRTYVGLYPSTVALFIVIASLAVAAAVAGLALL
jgi:hypothetical protein